MKENCPICNKEFEYNEITDSYLIIPLDYFEEYPVQDDIWASRKWNIEHTDYNDISAPNHICHSCYDKRVLSEDRTVDGHSVCAKKGCAKYPLSFSKYCPDCYEEAYPYLS